MDKCLNRQKIAILGASDFQNPLILKAKDMGLETHVFAWQCGDIGESTADCFHPISLADKNDILKVCKEVGISGITTCGSDFAVVAQNYVAEAMNLPCNGTKTTLPCTNKYAMREAISKAGLPVPRFVKVTAECPFPEKLKALTFPLIVKPTDRSGSRAIAKVQNIEELKSAIAAAMEVSFTKEAIVEEVIDGPEYSCESITYKGQHHILQLTKKYTTGAPAFIETGHDQPSDIPEAIVPEVHQQIKASLSALGIVNSASHAEFRLQPDGTIRIIEIGARMGGDCIGSDLTFLSTGIDFLKATLQVALGQEPDLAPKHASQIARIRFFMTKQEAEDFQDSQIKGLVRSHISISKEAESVAVTDSSTRLGYYITTEKQ